MRSVPTYNSPKDKYQHRSVEDMMELYEGGELPHLLAIDTETYWNDSMVAPQAISKWINGGRNNCPFGVSIYDGGYGYWVTGESPAELVGLKPLLEDPTITKIFHNSQYDILMLSNLGINVVGPIMDTMCMIKLIDEEFMCKMPPDSSGAVKTKQSAKLKDLAYHFLGTDSHELEDLVHKSRQVIAANTGRHIADVSYLEVPDDIMKDYAIADTEYTYRLYEIFTPMMDAQELWPPYDDSINAMFAVVEMERNGMLIDQALMAKDETRILRTSELAKKRIMKLTGNSVAGTDFNPNSGAEMVAALEQQGLVWRWFTEKDEPQVDKATLAAIKAERPDLTSLLAAILVYRRAQKILSTYINGIREYIQEDGKVHASFYLWPNDYGYGSAVTGRLSSSNPNMQNLVKKVTEFATDDDDEEDFAIKVRRYFIPEPGCLFVLFDGNSQEFRMLGHYANDPNFNKMIRDGLDIHTGTAAAMFGVPYSDITEEQRAFGKTCNFAKVYAQGTLAFANSLRRARGMPPLDEKRVRQGTKFLYAKAPAYTYPPYSDRMTHDTIRDMATSDIILDGIDYYLSDEVQSWMKIAKAEDAKYFAQFPNIKTLIKEVADVARKRGYVKYWNGQRRHFKNPKEESYKALNSLIQGGCSSLLKVKMYEVTKYLHAQGLQAKLVASVHDEIILNMPIAEAIKVHIEVIQKILEDVPFRVPMTWGADYATGSWGDKQPIERLWKESV